MRQRYNHYKLYIFQMLHEIKFSHQNLWISYHDKLRKGLIKDMEIKKKTQIPKRKYLVYHYQNPSCT